MEDPEDLADLVGSKWLLVGEAGRRALAMIDTETAVVVRPPEHAPAQGCEGFARGGGLGVRGEHRGWRIVRIFHGATGDAVETSRIAFAREPIIEPVGCVAAPAAWFLNDVTPLPDGGFAATHMFDRNIPREAREAAFLAGTPTGYVVRWSPGKGWSRIAGSDGSFPNGIDASPDGRSIAFAETYGHRVNRIALDGSRRTSVKLAMQPDNVTALADGRFVVAGGTGAPLTSTRGCTELRRPGCAFPAAAVVVDFTNRSARTIVTSAGAATPGFSVATIKANKVYLGTAFGDRVTSEPLGPAAVELP